MNFMDHLEELKKRLTVSVVAVLIASVVSYIFIDELWAFLSAPIMKVLPAGQKELVFTSLLDPFFCYIKLAFICGLFFSSPVILYEIWAFIKPGLYVHERRFTAIFVIAGSLFFIGGACFGYFLIFPATFEILLSYAGPNMRPMLTMNEYFSLVSTLLIVFGVMFELPIIMFLLNKLGLVRVEIYTKHRRYAMILLVLLAAFITPTGDAVTLVLCSIPLVFLYEMGVIFSKIWGRKDKPVEQTKDLDEPRPYDG